MANSELNKGDLKAPATYVQEVPQEHVYVETDTSMRDIGLKAFAVYRYKGKVFVLDKTGNTLIFGELTGSVTLLDLINHVRNTLEKFDQKYVILPENAGIVATAGISSVSTVSQGKTLILANDYDKNILFWEGHPKKVTENAENFKRFIRGDVTEISWA